MYKKIPNYISALLVLAVAALSSCNSNQLATPEPEATNAQYKKPSSTPGNGNNGNNGNSNGNNTNPDYIVALSNEHRGPGAAGKIHSIIAQHNLGNNNHKLINGKAFDGFVVTLTPGQLASLMSDNDLSFIEVDKELTLPGMMAPPPVNYTISPMAGQNVSWGATLLGIGDGTITGRTAWLVDSGIQLDHPDLNVDVARSRSFIYTTTNPGDEFGHGTSVAGILAAKNNGFGTVGIASGATLVSLRIGSAVGTAYTSSMLNALNYAAEHAQPGDVVNISYGSTNISDAVEQAVMKLGDLGVYVVTAAGNSAVDALAFCPARVNHPNVFTVSGLRPDGTFMGISNWGPGIDFCAPGTGLSSTKMNSSYSTGVGGTSMAAPHLAGILLIRGGNNIPIQGYVQNDPDGIPDPIPQL